MGGVVDAIFGGGGDDVEGTNPRENVALFSDAQDRVLRDFGQFSTGLSTLDPRTGGISFDPTGRALNLGALGDFNANLGQTRNSLLGNQGAFMNARVNPLIDRLASGRGELSRGLNRTGVRGTFRQRALKDYDIAGERALGDARALATNDTLGALTALDQSLFNAGTGVGTNVFNQQMQELGLSIDTVNALKAIASNLATGASSTAAGASARAGELDQARQDNILGTLGTAATYAAYFFSDRRLKKNINHIGIVNGHNIYSFEYVWGEPSIGVMADEVLHIEGAVHKHSSGYLMVDYARLF